MNAAVLASGLCWITTPRELGVAWQLVQRENGDLLLVVVTPSGGSYEYPAPREAHDGSPTAIGALLTTLFAAVA